MNNSKEVKSPSYLEQCIKEMRDIVGECETADELESVLRVFP